MAKLARNGATNPLGKLSAEIPKFRVPEETYDEAVRAAREADMTLSEWVRNLVMIRVHGLDMVVKVQEERLRAVVGIGLDEGVKP